MISTLIPGAGTGKRIGLKKQFYSIKQKPILYYTLSIFQKSPLVNEIILVCPKSDLSYCRDEIVSKFHFTKVKKIVSGGSTRQASVKKGLIACSSKSNYILIHDAVRPFFSPRLLPRLISEAKKHKAVTVALPSHDTVKMVKGGKIIKTLPRENIFLVQTPQIFSSQLIKKAYSKANKDKYSGTDDSSLVERMGKKVKIFIGNEENIKITTLKDLKIAESFLKNIKRF